LGELARQLRAQPGVDQVTAFGSTLHVSGRNAARLEEVLAPFQRPPHEWARIRSGLEDVFIGLRDEARDNSELDR
jgi:ABC-2 type transport system ATP-binding protein